MSESARVWEDPRVGTTLYTLSTPLIGSDVAALVFLDARSRSRTLAIRLHQQREAKVRPRQEDSLRLAQSSLLSPSSQ
ncbi:hypothetical protein V8E52_003230 [Russula decolorans]